MGAAHIQKQISNGTLHLEWKNSQMQQDRSAIVFTNIFWFLWAPLTIFMTMLLLFWGPNAFLLIWLLGGWFGTLAVPYGWIQRRWFEWISISSEAVSFGAVGFLAREPKIFPLNNIQEIVIGYCPCSSGEGESIVTLNLYENKNSWNKRHKLAYWLEPSIKEEIFREIQSFVESNNLSLKLRRWT